MVMVGVDDHPQPVRVQEVHVPAAEAGAYRLPVVQPNPQIEGVLVEEDPHLRPLAPGLPLVGIHLGEAGHHLRPGPGRLVQVPVDLDGAGGSDRRHDGPLGFLGRSRVLSGEGPESGHQEDEHQRRREMSH